MQRFQEVRFGNVRKRLWLTLENPGYSIPSQLFSLVSISVVLTSIATMCINSIPEYQVGGAFGSVASGLLVLASPPPPPPPPLALALSERGFCCPDF